MKWLCWFLHDWFFIDGTQRRMCLRCLRYQTLWQGRYGQDWVDDNPYITCGYCEQPITTTGSWLKGYGPVHIGCYHQGVASAR